MSNHATDVVLEERSRTAGLVGEFPGENTDAEFRFGPDAIYIRPNGPGIDGQAATSIISELRVEISGRRRPPRRVLLDLDCLLVPSSMAIGLLLEMSKIASSVDATLEVAAEPRFREILGMLRLDGRYTMVSGGRRLAESIR